MRQASASNEGDVLRKAGIEIKTWSCVSAGSVLHALRGKHKTIKHVEKLRGEGAVMEPCGI